MSSIGVVYGKNKQKAINFFLELVFFYISKSFYSRQQDTPGPRRDGFTCYHKHFYLVGLLTTH